MRKSILIPPVIQEWPQLAAEIHLQALFLVCLPKDIRPYHRLQYLGCIFIAGDIAASEMGENSLIAEDIINSLGGAFQCIGS